MNYSNLHYQIGINLIPKVGLITRREILSKIDSVNDFFEKSPSLLSKKTKIKAKLFAKKIREEALMKADDVVNFNNKHGIRTAFIGDCNYPDRLKECIDAPITFFHKGELPSEDYRYVAIVGTRDCTKYGVEVTRQLVQSFQGRKIVVVSGLASGIDSWAHHFCLEYKVPTIAVLGHGLDTIYPAENRELAKKIIKQGCLISEFVPGTIPDRQNFPKRNRIVAGLCDATIVVESKLKGGSLITASLANDYNRDTFACPGHILGSTSLGCNKLIFEDKAHLLESPDSFLKMMGWDDLKTDSITQRKVFPNLTDQQKEVLNIINNHTEIQLEKLALEAKISISHLNTELFYLELEGAVLKKPGNIYMTIQ